MQGMTHAHDGSGADSDGRRLGTPRPKVAGRLACASTALTVVLASAGLAAAQQTGAQAQPGQSGPNVYQTAPDQNQNQNQSRNENGSSPQARPGQNTAANAMFARAKNLVGKTVRDTAGDELGTIKTLAVDAKRGQIAFAILQLGSWIGQANNNLYAVPFEAIEPSPGNDSVTLKISKAQLKQAKGFPSDHYPNMNSQAWAQQIDQQYGYPPYWQSQYQSNARHGQGWRGRNHKGRSSQSAARWLEHQGLSQDQAQQLQQAGFPQDQVQQDLEQAYRQRGMSQDLASSRAKQTAAQFQRLQAMHQHQQQSPQPGAQAQGSAQAGSQAGQGKAMLTPQSEKTDAALSQWLQQQGMSTTKIQQLQAAGYPRQQVQQALAEAYTTGGQSDRQARRHAQRMTRQFEQKKRQLTPGQARRNGQSQARSERQRGQAAASYQPQIERSDQLLGVTVQSPQEEKLGVLQDLVIDMREGRIAYAVVQHGGVLGFGSKLAAVPYTAVRLEPQRKLAIVDTTKATLERVSFSSDNWPDLTSEQWASRVHQAFNQQPYWQVYGYGFYVAPQSTNLSGKITNIEQPTEQANADQNGPPAAPRDVRATIQTDQGKTYTVELAPPSVLQSHQLQLNKGETLKVTGFETQRNGQTIFKAQSITQGNQTVQLRNRHGQPTWQSQQAGPTGAEQRNQSARQNNPSQENQPSQSPATQPSDQGA